MVNASISIENIFIFVIIAMNFSQQLYVRMLYLFEDKCTCTVKADLPKIHKLSNPVSVRGRTGMKGVLDMGKKTLKAKDLTTTAILIAIVLIMAFSPLGYFRTAGLEVSLITVPVVIGAMLSGPFTGAVLGGVFGITSFIQCFGFSPFGTVLLGINPVYTFIVCVPTRILMGYFTGIIFKAFKGREKIKNAGYFICGFLGALLNTVLFMGTLILFFWNTEYIQNINSGFGGLSVIGFVLAFVGINGLLEMPLACIAGGGISRAAAKALNK